MECVSIESLKPKSIHETNEDVLYKIGNDDEIMVGSWLFYKMRCERVLRVNERYEWRLPIDIMTATISPTSPSTQYGHDDADLPINRYRLLGGQDHEPMLR